MIKICKIVRVARQAELKLTAPQMVLKERLDRLSADLRNNIEQKSFFNFFKKSEEQAIRGVYIYGGVGQGKTMLMDMFYDKVQVAKHRIHFHEFMINVQKRLHENKNAGHDKIRTKESGLQRVCTDIVQRYRLLCLDEFHVTHISDAMILKELFTNLFSMGLTLVCTSNRAPEELYKNGLNRDRFLPFIPVLYKYCDIFNLNSEDFRQRMVSGDKIDTETFHLNRGLEWFLEEYARKQGVARGDIKGRTLQVTPLRKVRVPYCHGKTAFFDFSEFCGFMQGSVGVDSFLEIARNFHTVVLSGTPQFDTDIQCNDRLRIFIQLIDVLYEKNIKLIMSTTKPIINIFGSYGIIKLFEKLYTNVKLEELRLLGEGVHAEEFVKLAGSHGIGKSDATMLFNSLVEPGENVLRVERLPKMIHTHETLVSGKYPQEFLLYKLDVYGDNISEDEFQCSRTLSRLFHMTSNNYLERHRELYGQS